MRFKQNTKILAASAVAISLLAGCATTTVDRRTNPRVTERDRTVKGAGIGAVVGAAGAILAGKREADEILAGAAIGAGIGAGVGAYLDAQQEKLAQIPGTTVERVGDDTLLVHFDSDILFDVNSASLTGSSQDVLAEVGEVLNQYPKTAVVVQGHTDDTGTEELNQGLSERRATAVEGFLINRGVDPARITAVGYGENAPRADNASEEGRELNRRVDILLRARAR